MPDLKAHKKIQFPFALVLIVLMSVSIGVFHYYSLSEADFLSSDLKYEAPDEYDLASAAHDKLKAFESSGLNGTIFQDHYLFERIVLISFHVSPLDLTKSILRC